MFTYAITRRPGPNFDQGLTTANLAQHRPIHHITRPGTLDGGDVLQVDNHFFIGSSLRTNLEGATQLTQILNKYEHTAEVVSVASGLHLKSSMNTLGDNRLLLT